MIMTLYYMQIIVLSYCIYKHMEQILMCMKVRLNTLNALVCKCISVFIKSLERGIITKKQIVCP